MQRLKILFFLPSQADTNDIHHELVTRLASELEPLADIDLYTSTHIPNTEKLTSYSLVHVFGKNKSTKKIQKKKEDRETVKNKISGNL